jgi:hypothetical protein
MVVGSLFCGERREDSRVAVSVCGHDMRVWFQSGVQTVLCPVCWAEVDTGNIQVQEPARPVWTSQHLISALGLIWDRLVGYNTSHPDELTL